MTLTECFYKNQMILMEGALGERLKREYGLQPDPEIALASLIFEDKGKVALREIWSQYLSIAEKYKLPFMATTPTRRANYDRVKRSGYHKDIIAKHVADLRAIKENTDTEMYVGGLMGCKGDAYTGEGALQTEKAREFHKWQADLFYQEKIDFLFAGIMPQITEAVGMAQAMSDTGIPYIMSFTIQRNGRLIDGTTIFDAIERIDNEVSNKPLCFMTNCVHPEIALEALKQPFNNNHVVKRRFCGIQANTSNLSYQELDQAEKLHCTEPEDFADDMVKLYQYSKMKIFGGCCGTDYRHLDCMAEKLIKEVK